MSKDFLEDFDESGVRIEERSFGSLYPVVQWQNGAPALAALKDAINDINYRGGFFFDDETPIEIPGFESSEKVMASGDPISGFGSTSIKGQIIRTRRCWEVDADNMTERFASSDYDLAKEHGKPRQRVNVLFLPEGADDCVILTMRGMVASFFMSAQRGKEGPLRQVGTKLCNAATQLRRRKNAGRRVAPTPLAFFSVTLGAGLVEGTGKKKGDAPNFVEVGSDKKNLVTPVVWLDKPSEEELSAANLRATLNRFYAGSERFEKAQQLWEESVEWAEAWDPENIRVRRRSGSDAAVPAATEGLPGTDEMVL